MAVIKNGKIHGKVGNYVYRVVNGQSIVQSRPRKFELSKETKKENDRFADTSRMCSKIYRLMKDFALNKVDSSLFAYLFAFLKQNFFSLNRIDQDSFYDDWEIVSGTQNTPINAYLRVEEVLLAFPKMKFENDQCIIDFPLYKHQKKRGSFIHEATCFEYSVSMIHYDFKEDLALPLLDWNSGRYHLSDGFPENRIDVPLRINDEWVQNGLIVVCFGIRFFAAMESYGYLNTKEINPTSILGIVYKKELEVMK